MLNQQIDEAMMKSSTQYENKLPIQMHMGVVVLNYLKFVKKYTVIFWLWNQGNYQLKFGRFSVYWVHNNPTLATNPKTSKYERLHFVFFLAPTNNNVMIDLFQFRRYRKNHSWNAKVEDEKWCWMLVSSSSGIISKCAFCKHVSTCCFNTRKRMTFYKLGKTSFASSSSSSCLFKVIITRH